MVLTIVNSDFKIEKKVQGLGIDASYEVAEEIALGKALAMAGL